LVFGVGLLAFLLSLDSVIAANQTDAAVLRQVRVAWKSRKDLIKIFHFECELVEHVTKAAKPGATNLFGDAPVGTPTIDVELRSDIAFSYDRGKRSFKMEGQQWDELRAVPKDYLFRAIFDGEYKSLVQSGSMPHGLIDRRRTPDSDLITLTHLTAFWIAVDPDAYFKARAYETDKMRVGKQRVACDGRECVELRIPRGNAQWEGLLYVDPERSYVPVQLQQTLYPSGRPSSSASAKVKHFAINSNLDDALFMLSFPPGCHVSWITDHRRKYFVQLDDGSLKEIAESDYGRVGVK
jgi:hypothetical protein